MRSYDHNDIEKKWQEQWEKDGVYRAAEDTAKPKSYVLDMFPYPSGEGLHVGHPKGYIATDVFSRHKRMTGHSVLHPMGWDAFGLPAENYALKNKVHPRAAVEKNVAHFKEQLAKIGLDYDWGREINTTDPEFYKWTQWIFLKLLEKGLAYESYEPINWCPNCQTGLSNEDLDGNVCERCGTPVEKKPMRQWVLKITDYADRLLEDLKLLPHWQESIKESQRNWIGKSEGAEVDFAIKDASEKITVFTTRIDTLFGVTYVVLAPEHALVQKLMDRIENQNEVRAYIEHAKNESFIARTDATKEKTGVALEGVQAINPANGEAVPVWISDYVLGDYGTGAVMAVPAHDERDFAFAKKFELPIREVIEPTYCQTTEPGKIHEDEPFDHREAIIAVVKHWSEEKYIALRWKQVAWGTFITGGIEKGQTPETAAKAELLEEVGYKNARFIRDYGVVHGKFYHVPKKTNRNAHAHMVYLELENDERVEVDEKEHEIHDVLWLTMEELKEFLTPDTHRHFLRILQGQQGAYVGDGTLAHSGEFDRMESAEARVVLTEKFGRAKVSYKIRDWVFSRQRYWGEPIPVIHCEKCGVVPVPEKDLPVRLPDVAHYEPSGTGESPLATITEWVNVPCPKCGGAGKRETNTMPQWAGSSWYYLRYMDPKNERALVDPKKENYWAPVDLYVGGAEHATRHLIYARFWHKFLFDLGVISTEEPFTRLISVGLIQAEDGRKMSKRYGNVINPDDIIASYGADSLRVYEMFMGPFGDAIAWNTNSMVGARRFIERVWKLAEKPAEKSVESVERLLHKTIKKVGEDIESFKFNTAISAMMVFVNAAEKEGITTEQLATFLKILAPFAPHVAEELWHEFGNTGSVHLASWPEYDPLLIRDTQSTYVIQIDGKSRGEFTIEADASREAVEAAAREVAADRLAGKTVARTIVVPNRLVSFVLEK